MGNVCEGCTYPVLGPRYTILIASSTRLNSYSGERIQADVVHCYRLLTPTTVTMKEHRCRFTIMSNPNDCWSECSHSLRRQLPALEVMVGVIWTAVEGYDD